MSQHARKLGRLPRTFNQNIPHFSSMRLKYRGKEWKPLPAKLNYLTGMPADLGRMLNDHLGDCGIAGLFHARQIWDYVCNKVVLPANDNYVLATYELFCGYIDGRDATDNGAILQDVLLKYVNNGIPTEDGDDKLLGFVEVDVRIPNDIKRCIAEGGVCYIGIDIPEAWTQSAPESNWDDTSSPIAGGHCVILAGYDDEYFEVISWGFHFRMSIKAFGIVCSEAYMLLDKAWINNRAVSPFDMTEAELQADMADLKKAA